MGIEKSLGWACLIIAFVIYYVDGNASTAGRFINGMSIGFFIRAIYLDYKRIRQSRNNKDKS